jgi:hypothetical protein
MMEAVCSHETSVDFHLTTQRFIPEDTTLRTYFSSSFKLQGGGVTGISSLIETSRADLYRENIGLQHGFQTKVKPTHRAHLSSLSLLL